jgi:hypothetical protein
MLTSSTIQRSLSGVSDATPQEILQLQRAIGNRAVASLLDSARPSRAEVVQRTPEPAGERPAALQNGKNKGDFSTKDSSLGKGQSAMSEASDVHIQTNPENLADRQQSVDEVDNPRISHSVGESGVIQRAIAIGTQHLPRTLDNAKLAQHFNPAQIQEILKLHAERDKIYLFHDDAHFISYFTTNGGFPPLVQNVSQTDLQHGHQMANAWRFGTLYQPSSHQVPPHAPGVHNIPEKELPPSGPGHMWARTTEGLNPQYTMWSHQFQPPTNPTEFHTFGNPNNPSIWSSQANFNMGGRVQPAAPQFLADVPRSQTTYGGLQSETDFVRGHPMSLAQQQRSTDPNSNATFDDTWEVYTRESDGTKGGFSTFRYNAIENPAQKNMLPFNQVNISSNPNGVTQMGIPPVDRIMISAMQQDGTYQQMDFDNTYNYRPDYDASGSTDRFHTWLKNHVTSNNFPYEQVFQQDKDYLDPNRHNYPGYMSPPPTPFLAPELRDTDNNVVLNGHHYQGEIILHNGDPWQIKSADYDANQDKTTCELEKAFTKPLNLFS